MADPSTEYHLSFCIGPVQDFVSQARRTRDLWCGSWMLTHLAECALAAAEKIGGKKCRTVIPFRPVDHFGQVISRKHQSGGIPNRFELVFGSEDLAIQAARDATSAFNQAWSEIADIVWTGFIENATSEGENVRSIWDRQVGSFWDVTWAIGQPNQANGVVGNLAAARKNFRDSPTSAEEGTKCSLMGDLQELSGHSRRRTQDAFWRAVRRNAGSLDLAEGERLCAIAVIKRFFPRKSSEYGCEYDLSNVNWPSTAFLAAQPWLSKLTARAEAKQYADDAVKTCGISRSEERSAKDAEIAWASVDASVWFRASVENSDQLQLDENQRRELSEKLSALYRLAGDEGEPSQPVPYYGLLLLDGDSLGNLLSEMKDPTLLSKCLNAFNGQVDEIVQKCHGRTVYAGGDDVLLVAPGSQALAIAEELNVAYRNAFVSEGVSEGVATISGAIVYAHYKHPLRQVLKQAHHLLDNIAKDKTGRDSLAIGIIQGGGINAIWSAPWAVVMKGSQSHGLRGILHRFSQDDEGESDSKLPSLNGSFLYRLRDQFSRLFPNSLEQTGCFGQLADLTGTNGEASADILISLAHAEYRRRMTKQQRTEISSQETLEQLRPLMQLSQRTTRMDGAIKESPQTFGFDGWRVARFLRQIEEGKVSGDDD